MTSTTELLKGCGEEISRSIDRILIICGKGESFTKRMSREGIRWTVEYKLCSNCKSQLRGRLDALKEEVKFLDKLQLETQFRNYINPMIDNRLASIQEEIKLIQSAGVGK